MGAETVLIAILSALIYSVVFFAKHHLTDKPESLDPAKLGATLITGAILGTIFYAGGLAITAEAIETQLIAYVSVVAIVESVLKIIYRSLKKIV